MSDRIKDDGSFSRAVSDAAIKFGIDTLESIPKDDNEVIEAHITGVLIVFLGALWGTFGTEFARGFIEAQLRSMEPDRPIDIFVPPSLQ